MLNFKDGIGERSEISHPSHIWKREHHLGGASQRKHLGGRGKNPKVKTRDMKSFIEEAFHYLQLFPFTKLQVDIAVE